MAEQDILTVSNLMVVHFPEEQRDEVTEEMKTNKNVICGESCARQVFYGVAENLESIPGVETIDATKLYGAKAYEFMLALAAGFESAKFGETHIKSQIFGHWKKKCRDDFFKAARYQSFIGNLRRDTNYAQELVMSRHLSEEDALVARDLSGQKDGQQVVIFGDLSSRGKVSSFTERMIRVSENTQAHNDNFISISHPDEQTLALLQTALIRMLADGKLRSELTFAAFKKLPSLLKQADQVYSCIPMGTQRMGEAEIINTWSVAGNKRGHFTHLSGMPKSGGMTAEFWSGANLPNYTGPEEIVAEKARRKSHNAAVVADMDSVFEEIASIREQGREVRIPELKERVPAVYC